MANFTDLCVEWHEQTLKTAGPVTKMSGFLMVYPTCVMHFLEVTKCLPLVATTQKYPIQREETKFWQYYAFHRTFFRVSQKNVHIILFCRRRHISCLLSSRRCEEKANWSPYWREFVSLHSLNRLICTRNSFNLTKWFKNSNSFLCWTNNIHLRENLTAIDQWYWIPTLKFHQQTMMSSNVIKVCQHIHMDPSFWYRRSFGHFLRGWMCLWDLTTLVHMSISWKISTFCTRYK